MMLMLCCLTREVYSQWCNGGRKDFLTHILSQHGDLGLSINFSFLFKFFCRFRGRHGDCSMLSPHEVLGLSPTASEQEVCPVFSQLIKHSEEESSIQYGSVFEAPLACSWRRLKPPYILLGRKIGIHTFVIYAGEGGIQKACQEIPCRCSQLSPII